MLKSSSKRLMFFILILVCFNCFAVAQKQYYSWDFSDCDIRDILFAVSIDTGISIVPDDTVSGVGSLKFAGNDFSEAFEAFLNGSRLYVSKGDKVWTVSKFNSCFENGLYYVNAYDLLPVQIIEKLAKKCEKVITFDSLPAQKISVHFNGLEERSLLESLCRRFGNYELLLDANGYHISKKNDLKSLDLRDGYCSVAKNEDGFSFNLKNCYFEEVIEKLFELYEKDEKKVSYCFLNNGEIKIQRAVFNSADFNGALEKLCWQSGFSFLVDDNVYYIYQDANSKSLLLTAKRFWTKFSLDYTKSQDFIPILHKRIGKVEVIELSDKYSFLGLVSETESVLIQELIETVDLKQDTYLITLKYLKPEEVLKNLPPNVDKEGLFLSEDMKSIYFRGTEKSYEILLEELKVCDRPKTRITYDLLILQYDETQQNFWSSNFDFQRLNAHSRNSISGVLGSVMGLNLNVISAFGLNFAMELQSSIENNNTRVYADTTLHGISGKQINFQNTNTFRYRDNNVNPDTGAPVYTGITREIISGIKLDILGWVSGDGMVTSKVTASISRQGVDTSGSTGNPPPTSEKIVTTEVCGKSGEVIVLSGLVLTSDTNQEKRTPLISKIPLLGYLFKTKSSTKENTQMIIYLVPHVEDLTEQTEVVELDEKWAMNRLNKLDELAKQI